MSKEVTKAFLNAILAGKRKIVSLELGMNEYPVEIKTERVVVMSIDQIIEFTQLSEDEILGKQIDNG